MPKIAALSICYTGLLYTIFKCMHPLIVYRWTFEFLFSTTTIAKIPLNERLFFFSFFDPTNLSPLSMYGTHVYFPCFLRGWLPVLPSFCSLIRCKNISAYTYYVRTYVRYVFTYLRHTWSFLPFCVKQVSHSIHSLYCQLNWVVRWVVTAAVSL